MQPNQTLQPHPERRIQAADVRDLLGGVSHMWIERRLNNPQSNFPRPVKIGNRRFWREREILAWIDAQGGAQSNG